MVNRVARRDGRDKPYLVRLWEVLYVVLPSGCYAFGGEAWPNPNDQGTRVDQVLTGTCLLPVMMHVM